MRILVVEDNESVSHFVVKGLREAGHAVDLVERGDLVLPALCLAPYDLLVLDLMLPGLSGFQVLQEMRERGNQTAVLILTAKDLLADKVKGLNMGADDYLVKPFSFTELLARIRAILRRSEDRDPVLRFGSLVFNPITHEVSRAGRRLDLTAKEFSLLGYLLQNKNHVLTRTTLVEHVWDINFDSDTNLVDVFISKLRTKLEENGEPRLIQTVRGVGYVLREEE